MFTECMLITIKMFACFEGVTIFCPFCDIQADVKLCFRLFDIPHLANDTFQHTDSIATLAGDLVKDVTGHSGLNAPKRFGC